MDLDLKPHADVDAMAHLTDIQKERVRFWMRLQSTLNEGNFGPEMDAFFHPEMTYSNPNRPDLGSYESWKKSPEEMYKRFPPSHYRVVKATAEGNDIIWVLCHQAGVHTGGKYMGRPPTGNEINTEWFSIVTFKDNKIFNIFSIADVLGLLVSSGVIDPKIVPANPYQD